MHDYRLERGPEGPRVRCPLRGRDLMIRPLWNKGTAFTREEREAFGLTGLLPPAVNDIELQTRRAADNILRKTEPLERYIGLAALQDRNEVLFYRVLLTHAEELLPVVYTPTVGLACQRYSRIFRRPRGTWITPEHQGRVDEVLANLEQPDVRLIVVTDNERILGLGDQGAGGIGIPIGKLALYTLAAGIHPARTLPISLDVGTDNEELLQDELYLGWRHPRLRGERYAALVEEFVQAVQRRWPRVLLQWEDFKKGNAFTLLDRYRERILSFNDDIQGTAAVALAACLAASRVSGVPLAEQRFVILGAGAAGIGIARQLRDALARAGLAGPDLVRAVALVDSRGLLVRGGHAEKEPYKLEFAWPPELAAQAGLPGEGATLRQVVEALAPTALLGTSGQPGVFDQALVRSMAARTPRPAIFPLSNPTANSEATPADLLAWSDGRALVATGSPFAPVSVDGQERVSSQANNVYVFPGVGLGALVSGARQVTDRMFTAAAEALAGEVSEWDLARGALLPPLRRLRELTALVAAAVVREVQASDLGEPIPAGEVEQRVVEAMWYPEYPAYVPA